MRKLKFSKQSEKTLRKMNGGEYERILWKILWYRDTKDPTSFARKLVNSSLWTRRRRICERRVIFDIDEQWNIIIIQVIWKRKEIYS
jgi:mRNA-degrading endonuclease RelE of RelBE toxin-antitoxin system